MSLLSMLTVSDRQGFQRSTIADQRIASTRNQASEDSGLNDAAVARTTVTSTADLTEIPAIKEILSSPASSRKTATNPASHSKAYSSLTKSEVLQAIIMMLQYWVSLHETGPRKGFAAYRRCREQRNVTGPSQPSSRYC